MSAGAIAAGTAISGLLDAALKQKAEEDRFLKEKKLAAENDARTAQMNSMNLGMQQSRAAGKDENDALGNLLGIFQKSYT